jgi:hypothetical protein
LCFFNCFGSFLATGAERVCDIDCALIVVNEAAKITQTKWNSSVFFMII